MRGAERGRNPGAYGGQYLPLRRLRQHRRRHRRGRQRRIPVKTFDFQHAATVVDAIRSVLDTGGAYLAGGTNLVDLMKNGVAQPPALVDIRHLGLNAVTATASGGVRIGAGVSNSAL